MFWTGETYTRAAAVAIGLALVGIACLRLPDPYDDNQRFPCAKKSDCIHGYACVESVCRRTNGTGDGGHHRPLTITSGILSGCSTSLSDFPLLVRLQEPWLKNLALDPNGRIAHPNGEDIYFAGPDGARLDHEIDQYDATSGSLVAWVRIPTLAADQNTSLTLFYGDPSITAPTQNPAGVWDANFQAVYHLSQDPWEPVLDSTGHANLDSGGTLTSANRVATPMGSGIQFVDEGDPHVDHLTSSNVVALTSFTLEIWAAADTWSSPMEIGGVNDHHGVDAFSERDLWIEAGGNVYVSATYPTPNYGANVLITEGPLTVGAHSFAGRYDSTTGKLEGFVDLQPSPGPKTIQAPMVEGYVDLGAFSEDGLAWRGTFHGGLDEVRISDVARSDCYLRSTYRSQQNPELYLRLGDEE